MSEFDRHTESGKVESHHKLVVPAAILHEWVTAQLAIQELEIDRSDLPEDFTIDDAITAIAHYRASETIFHMLGELSIVISENTI